MPQTSCVTLGELLNLSVPQGSTCKMGMLRDRVSSEESAHIKGLEQHCLAHGKRCVMLAIIIMPALQTAQLRLVEDEELV